MAIDQSRECELSRSRSSPMDGANDHGYPPNKRQRLSRESAGFHSRWNDDCAVMPVSAIAGGTERSTN
eukprot:216531-Rhodomonas_salina.6